MALFPRELKHEYLQARYAQYRTFALRLGIATVFVPMGLWLRDDLSYAAGAWDTLGFRLLMSAGVLAYVAALALRAPRRVVLLAAYLGVLAIDVAASMVWGAVPIHASVGFADYVYLFLLAPLLLLPLSLFEVVAVLVTACLVPNLQAAFGMEPHYSLPLFNLVMWPACLLAAFSLYQFDLVFRRLFLIQRQVSEQALMDPLTGLGNRRYFDERGDGVLALARRRGRPFSVLMIDIDHFKRVNDEHGHAVGDEVLRALGNALKAIAARRRRLRPARRRGVRGGAARRERRGRRGDRRAAAPRAGAARRKPRGRARADRYHGQHRRRRLPGGRRHARGAARSAPTSALFRAKQGGRNRVVAAD